MSAAINPDGDLEVSGLPAAPNNIVVNAPNPAAVTGLVNGVPFGPFDVTGRRVVVRGGSGRDLIQISGHLPCEVYGRGGSDRLYGSEGGSVIVAEDGSPFLVGGGGVNALVGGPGVSVLQSAGGGLLLAGTTAFTAGQLRALADAFCADPVGTDLSALLFSFKAHTTPGKAQLSGSTVRPNAFFCRADDLVMNYDPAKGDQLFTV